MFNEVELASRVNCKSISVVEEFFFTKSKVSQLMLKCARPNSIAE